MKSRIVKTLLPIVSLLVVMLIAHFQPHTQREASLEYVESGLEDYKQRGLLGVPQVGFGGHESLDAVLLSAIDLLNTRYGYQIESIRTNTLPPNEKYIDVYFIKEDPDGKFERVMGNCAFIGAKNIILCDLTFVDRLQGADSKPTYPEMPKYLQEELGVSGFDEVQQSRNQNILYWILLHELGHIAHRHDARHFTSHSSSKGGQRLKSEISANELPFPQEEQEADHFLIETLQQFDPVTAWSLAHIANTGLNSFIYRELATEAKQQGLAGKAAKENHLQLSMRSDATHPPLLIRAIRVNVRLVSEFRVEDPEFTNRILKTIDVRITD